MKILHLNAGNETGGGMYHILSLLNEFGRDEFILGVLERGEMLKRAKKSGIRTVFFENRTRYSIPVLQKLKKYIKEQEIGIVHTHGPRANVYASILSKMVHFNWVVTIHSNPVLDFMEKGIYGRFLCKLNVQAIKKADKVIAISQDFCTRLEKLGVSGERIVTALNGIDFKKRITAALDKQDFGIDSDHIVFLKVARLEHVKGHHIAFHALAKLLRLKEHCHLLVVGDGELKKSLQSLASDLGIQRHVHFLGYRNDVDKLYQMADITLLTSLSESFPLVLLESARAETPVIATNVGGVTELVKNQSLGWVVQPNNIQELTAAMKQAIFFHQKGMLQKMGRKLYQHASSSFSVENFANRIYQVYEKVKNG